MIQNSNNDFMDDIGRKSYVYKRKHNISNVPKKKELSNENKKNSNKYKILLLILLLFLIILILFFGIYFGLKTKKDDNHIMNINLKNNIDNNTYKIIDNSIESIDSTIYNNIDHYVEKIDNTIDNNLKIPLKI